jgi:histidyl-tRNA synthetase
MIAKRLRENGIKTEVYMGKGKGIGKQLKYADAQKMPVAVIAGSREFENNEVSIKDLGVIKETDTDIKERSEWIKKRVGQKTVPIESLVEEIKAILEACR